jgi:hypothetical protein
MVARAAYKTDEETRHLVASLQPRPPTREGIRKLPAPAACVTATAPEPAEAPAAEPEPFALAPPARPPSRPSSGGGPRPGRVKVLSPARAHYG